MGNKESALSENLENPHDHLPSIVGPSTKFGKDRKDRREKDKKGKKKHSKSTDGGGGGGDDPVGGNFLFTGHSGQHHGSNSPPSFIPRK